MINYEDLNKHFTAPVNISPFYNSNDRIHRKLKKRVKKYCGVHWKNINNGQRLWFYLDHKNPNYKRFIINKIIEKY